MSPLPERAPVARAQIVGIARRWIGTAYHHQASVEGVGCDCIGLVRGVFRELYGFEPEPLPGYSRDWAEATGIETLIEGANRHLRPIAINLAKPGDVFVFRHRPRLVAKHTGIIAQTGGGTATFIHALEGTTVSEVPLGPWWIRRVAAAFSFPGIID